MKRLRKARSFWAWLLSLNFFGEILPVVLASILFAALVFHIFFETKDSSIVLTSPIQAIISDGVRNLGLLLAASIGWFFLHWRARIASQDAKTAEKVLTAEQFTRAIEQIANENSSIRLGGILGLEQIADTHEEECVKVARILSAYIRELAPRIKKEKEPKKLFDDISSMTQEVRKQDEKNIRKDEELLRKRRDIEAAVEILARIASKLTYEEQYNKRKRNLCDLRNTELCEFRFVEVDLSDFNFTNSDFTKAWLNNTNFTRARLNNTFLGGAFLDEANLKDARLDRATLNGASLKGTDLSGARLDYASLSGAKFKRASLLCAFLQNANLTGSVFCMANLSGAYLVNSDLSGTQLTDANISGAKFQGAKNMRQSQFDDAYYWEGFPPDMPDDPPDPSNPSKTWKLPPVLKTSKKEKQDLLEAMKRRDTPTIDEKEDPLRPQDQ